MDSFHNGFVRVKSQSTCQSKVNFATQPCKWQNSAALYAGKSLARIFDTLKSAALRAAHGLKTHTVKLIPRVLLFRGELKNFLNLFF